MYGLLLLLLLSSTLFVCTLSQPNYATTKQQKDPHHRLQKRLTKTEAADYVLKIVSAASPFIELIPIAGSVLTQIIELVNAGKEVWNLDPKKPDPTKMLFDELKKLENQLNKYQAEQKWDIWASQYSKFERDINVGWAEFQNLMKVLADKTKKDKKNDISEFKRKFQNIALSTSRLHQVLTDKKSYFAPDFKKLISENLKCHEHEIRVFTAFINGIIYKGNTVSYYYNGLVKADSINALAEIAFDCAKATFEIHKDCINNSLQYVKKDVETLISKNTNIVERKQLAKIIRSFLESTYDRYNWIVVVFITADSKHEFFDILNEHILTGFTEVSNGEITAAIARQVKGTHTQTDKIRKGIEACFKRELADCREVKSGLDKCGKYDGIDLSQVYTAIHAYIDESDDSFKALNAKEAPEEYIGLDTSAVVPYVYKGMCKKYKLFSSGKFRVLIKSDEEIAKKSPCEKVQCNKGKGKCELLDNNNIPVCKCEEKSYGESCEESIEDYKQKLRNTKK